MADQRQIPIGVVAGALSADARAAALAARAAGFAGVQFDAITAGLDLTALSDTGRRQFRQMLRQQDVQLIGLRAQIGAKGFGPGADVDQVLWRIDRVLETAAALAAPLVCLDIGPLPPAPITETTATSPPISTAEAILLPTVARPKAVPRITRLPDPNAISQVDAALAELGKRADRYGVMIALRSELSALPSLHRALTGANCPWFAIDLDPVPLLCDQQPADEAFAALGNLIGHIRGRDAISGAAGRTRAAAVGKGSTDWRQLLALLDEAAFSGWITIDPMELTDRAAGAAAGLAYLRRL